MTGGLFGLDGRAALITGAAGGIGTAIITAFANAGAHLVITDTGSECVAQAKVLTEWGVPSTGIPADLSKPEDVKWLAARALEAEPKLDVLICNAGIEGPVGSLSDAKRDALDKVFEVNLLSIVALTGAVIPAMAKNGGGSVILMSSIAGLRGNKRIGAYGMTKAALAQLARNLAVEWGPQNVRVNAISPGLIRTPLAKGTFDDKAYLERRLSLTPLRRAGEPEEIASVVQFLASRASAFITGHNLVVDGGTLVSDGN